MENDRDILSYGDFLCGRSDKPMSNGFFFRRKLKRKSIPVLEKNNDPDKNARREALMRELAELESAEAARTLPKVKRPIAFKLVSFVVILLLLSLSAITVMVSRLVSADVRVTAEDNNYNINQRASLAAETDLNTILQAVSALLDDLAAFNTLNLPPETKEEAKAFFFKQDAHIAAVVVIGGLDGKGGNFTLISKTFPEPLIGSQIEDFIRANAETVTRTQAGEILLRNGSAYFDQNLTSIFFPWQNTWETTEAPVVVALFSPETLAKSFHSGINTSFMLNELGDLLVHPDKKFMREGENYMYIDFVRNALEGSGSSMQTLYKDKAGKDYFGAFNRISLNGSQAGITAQWTNNTALVLTIISTEAVFNGIKVTTIRNIVLSSVVLLVSILLVLIYSRTISRPLRALTRAAGLIEAGDYDLRLTCKSHDEIGILTQSFISMGNGLVNFEKFTNKTIVRLARQGKLQRTGISKTVTVCFAYIRDFSKYWGNRPAKDVVQFVNDFLSRVVPCITSTGGEVDKFLTQGGVVVMALWGAVQSNGSAADDALACVRSALMMRASLRSFNEERFQSPELLKRFGKNLHRIKLGCGINTGEVVSGQMGSEERMEYTVIGDAVNLAARIEGPNDLFDTDILISESVYDLTGDKVLVEEMPSLEIKGKKKPLRVWSVINSKDSKETAKIFSDLEKISGAQSWLTRLCVGPNGPLTQAEVREAWK